MRGCLRCWLLAFSADELRVMMMKNLLVPLAKLDCDLDWTGEEWWWWSGTGREWWWWSNWHRVMMMKTNCAKLWMQCMVADIVLSHSFWLTNDITWLSLSSRHFLRCDVNLSRLCKHGKRYQESEWIDGTYVSYRYDGIRCDGIRISNCKGLAVTSLSDHVWDSVRRSQSTRIRRDKKDCRSPSFSPEKRIKGSDEKLGCTSDWWYIQEEEKRT